MSEIRKCRCGSTVVGVGKIDRGIYRVDCACGRTGPFGMSEQDAAAQWNSDRLAEEKAREALRNATSVLRDLSFAGASGNAKTRDLVDVRGQASAAYKEASEAIALLEAR